MCIFFQELFVISGNFRKWFCVNLNFYMRFICEKKEMGIPE